MAEDWQPVEKVQKNDAGEYRALVGGQWVPASRAQKSPDGAYRAILGFTATEDITADNKARLYGIEKGILPDPSQVPTNGMSDQDKFMAGVGGAATKIGRSLGQLVGAVSPQDVLEARKRDAPLMNTGPGAAGDLAGNLAVTAIPGMALGRGATALAGAAGVPAAIAPTLGAGVSGAAIGGLTTPTAPGESRVMPALAGAAGGVGGDMLARGMARVAQPITQTPGVQTLLQNGIVPTPGQSAGANSILGRIEQKLQSIPIIGDIITGGRNRAATEFNQAAINRAAPNGIQLPPGVGREGIENADRVLHQGYENVLNRIGTVNISPNFSQSVARISRDPDIALSPAMRERLDQIVGQQIINRDPASSALSAQVAKRADANLGMLARGYASSQNGDERMLANALREVQTEWRNNIRASAPTPQIAAELDGLNAAFANFVRVERAAGSVGARDGVFSPAQLNNAVRATDTSARHNQFARGNALMQDLTDPGMAHLQQSVPNSGTTDRAALALMLGGGAAGGANEYMGGPGYLTAAALSPLMFSRAGSRYAVGDLIPGQQGLANLLRSTAPVAAQGGRTLSDFLQQR